MGSSSEDARVQAIAKRLNGGKLDELMDDIGLKGFDKIKGYYKGTFGA
jgi:ribosomal protein L12E/L44/L45/RPP1/RPP2